MFKTHVLTKLAAALALITVGAPAFAVPSYHIIVTKVGFPTASTADGGSAGAGAGGSGTSSGPGGPATPSVPASCTLPWGDSLPSGASITAYATSAVSYPTSCNSVAETVTCTDGTLNNPNASQSCAVVPTVSLSAASLTSAVANSLYNYDLNQALAVGDAGYDPSMVTWAVVDGSLPAGVSLSESGILSGVASTSAVGIANFTIKATYKSVSSQHSYALGVTASSCTLPWGGSLASGSTVPAYTAASVMSPSTCASVAVTETCDNGTLSAPVAVASCSVTKRDCTLPWGGTLANDNAMPAYSVSSVLSPASCASAAITESCSDGTLSYPQASQGCTVTLRGCTLPWGGYMNSGDVPITAYTAYQVVSPATCSSVATAVSCNDGTLSDTAAVPVSGLYSTCKIKAVTYALMTENVTAAGGGSVYQSSDGLSLYMSGYRSSARANQGVSSGKWYWEVTTAGTLYEEIGVSNRNLSMSTNWGMESAGNSAVGYYLYPSSSYACDWTGCGITSTTPVAASGSVLGIALDADNNTITWYVNGVRQGMSTTTNSTRLAGLMATKTTYPLYPTVGTGQSSVSVKVNFGQTPFAYPVPTGFNRGLYQ